MQEIINEVYDLLGKILQENKTVLAKVRKLQAEKNMLKDLEESADSIIIL